MFSLFDAPMHIRRYEDPFFFGRSYTPRARVLRPAYYLLDLLDHIYDPFYDEYENDQEKQGKQGKEDKGEHKENKENKENQQEHKETKPHETESKKMNHPEEPIHSCICTRSVITRRNGIEHVQKEVYDKVSGKRTTYETRRIGDRSMTLLREMDRNGVINEEETRENLNDEDLDVFKKEWVSRYGGENLSIDHDEEKGKEKDKENEKEHKEQSQDKEEPKDKTDTA